MSKKIVLLKQYRHPMNGAQLDGMTIDRELTQIHCGETIEIEFLGKFIPVTIEMEYDLGRYYGITEDGYNISNLNNKTARIRA